MQLLFLHFRKNQFLLVLWIILFGISFQQMGKTLGIPYLMLDPEYQDEVEFAAMFIFGISFGGFTMAFNITAYILDSYRFSFLGSIRRPFVHFCLNNSFIPLLFVITYSYNFWRFQTTHFQAGDTRPHIFLDLMGFYSGAFIIVSLIFLYFLFTNKDYIRHFVNTVDSGLKKNRLSRANIVSRLAGARSWSKVYTSFYLSIPKVLKKVNPNPRIDREAIIRVFDQHQFNALLLQLIALASLILVGYFRNKPVFQIPAIASGLLFGTIVMMFAGALVYWLRGWAITFLIIGIIVFNELYKEGFFQKQNQAIGMNYDIEPASYNIQNLSGLSNDSLYNIDKDSTLKVLEAWRSKFPKYSKPPMIFLCTTGGGQRSAVWTVRVMQEANRLLGDKLMKHTFMITGASGGMIGAAYFREIYRRKQGGLPFDLSDDRFFWNIAKDNLNPVIQTMVMSDLFIRIPESKDEEGNPVYRDRGYAFEDKITRNMEYFLDRKVFGYADDEKASRIPWILLGPTTVNDGRKIYISGIPVSYMNRGLQGIDKDLITHTKGIEYSRFFERHDPEKIDFITALRMSATFPYITPYISLPSDPPMQIMDAGITDNFGSIDAARFISVFKDWIEENTGGVIILRIRDNEKIREVKSRSNPSLFSKFLNPISSIYIMWGQIQEINSDSYLEFVDNNLRVPVNVLDFEYDPKYHPDLKVKGGKEKWQRAALSWHLTKTEKQSLYHAIDAPSNQIALKQLGILLRDKPRHKQATVETEAP